MYLKNGVLVTTKYTKIINVGYLCFFIVGVWGPIALRNLALVVGIEIT